MSWSDFHQRRAAIKAVLRYAEEQPSATLPYAHLPEVTAIFASPTELLMALQYDWSQALWGQLELLTLEADTGHLDASAVCRQAWHNAAARHPTLRRLLDGHLVEHDTRHNRIA